MQSSEPMGNIYTPERTPKRTPKRTPESTIYLNFPIQLLQGAFSNINGTMDDILNYTAYRYTLKLNGTNTEKMKSASNYFGINFGNPHSSYQFGKTLYDSLPENSPMVGINTDVCFDYYEHSKTTDEIAVLLAFLAIKSIIGIKPYSKVTNAYLIVRMAGYASIDDMPHSLPHPLPQYTSRRKLDRIKKELQLNWNVNIYGVHTRGWYVSVDSSFDMNKLALEAEKRRNKEKQLKQRKDEARRLALEKLNNSGKTE
jgi:hypothetical protein